MPRFIDKASLNEDAFEAAKAAMLIKTGGNRDMPAGVDDEHRDYFLDEYVRHGGVVFTKDEVERKPGTVDVGCTTKVDEEVDLDDEEVEPEPPPPLVLKIIEMTFHTDHGVLLNNSADWDNEGALYTKPDWTPTKSNIVSHSIDTPVQVTVVIKARGEGAETGHIRPKVGGKLIFPASAVSFTAGSNTSITMTSNRNFATELGIPSVEFDWFVNTDRRDTSSIGKTQNQVLFTFDTPIPLPSEPDDGFTVKRMKTAIRVIKATNKTDDRQEMVKMLMAQFTFYCLTSNPAVPARYGHPQFTDAKAGAWPMVEYSAQSGECQAICRCIRGLLNQVGCLGAEMVVVWCDPVTVAAKEATFGSSGSGLRFSTKTIQKNVVVDQRVVVTEELGFIDSMLRKKPTSHIEIRRVPKTIPETWTARLTTSAATLGQDAENCGLNLYEACLKFTDTGVTKYYGGGAGSYNTATGVVRSFHSLIWIHFEENPLDKDGPLLSICKEIVHTF